jgi:DNA-binding MarR family transcriptional regulator
MQRTRVRDVAAALQMSVSLLRRRVNATRGEQVLSLPEMRTISRIDRLGPCTTAELARQEQITPQAMGSTVAVLESRGLIKRADDPQDGRRSILTLTKEGKRELVSGRLALTDRLTTALAESFTDEEIELLREAAPLIERLAESL